MARSYSAAALDLRNSAKRSSERSRSLGTTVAQCQIIFYAAIWI